MSLIYEIADDYLPDHTVNGMDCPNTELAKEVINKVLDAAVEAAMGACGNDDGSMYDWQVEEAINKLRGEG